MSAVSKEDVVRLHTYLVVPVAVSDALAAAAPIDGETQYALHVALSEIDPDSALLAIALSAHRLSLDFTRYIPAAAALRAESGQIVEQYGPEWLANYHDHPVSGDRLYDLLSHIPEDLESLADLLESVRASIRDPQDPAATICTVLAVQARAHMEIADYVLSELENDTMEESAEDGDDGVCRFTASTVYAEQPGANIILFPVHRRR